MLLAWVVQTEVLKADAELSSERGCIALVRSMSCPKCKKGQLLAMTGPFGDLMRYSRKGRGHVELVPDEDSR